MIFIGTVPADTVDGPNITSSMSETTDIVLDDTNKITEKIKKYECDKDGASAIALKPTLTASTTGNDKPDNFEYLAKLNTSDFK